MVNTSIIGTALDSLFDKYHPASPWRACLALAGIPASEVRQRNRTIYS